MSKSYWHFESFIASHRTYFAVSIFKSLTMISFVPFNNLLSYPSPLSFFTVCHCAKCSPLSFFTVCHCAKCSFFFSDIFSIFCDAHDAADAADDDDAQASFNSLKMDSEKTYKNARTTKPPKKKDYSFVKLQFLSREPFPALFLYFVLFH